MGVFGGFVVFFCFAVNLRISNIMMIMGVAIIAALAKSVHCVFAVGVFSMVGFCVVMYVLL